MATKQEQRAKWAKQRQERSDAKAEAVAKQARRDEAIEESDYLHDPEGADVAWLERALRKRRTRPAGTEELQPGDIAKQEEKDRGR